MATKYGRSPWGAWFIQALDGYGLGERLVRGRTYANTGKVTKLKVAGGVAEARVAGNYQPFYQVSIEFKPLPDHATKTIFFLIDDDAMILSRIVAGELPTELLEQLQARKIELIPTKWADMNRACNCPDFGDPCKHQAAVYYMLAREIDADPRMLFSLRGIDLASRYGAAVQREIQSPLRMILGPQRKEPQCALDQATPFAPPDFEHYGNFIQALLPPNSIFCERDFSVILGQFYHHSARSLDDLNSEQEVDWTEEQRLSHANWVLELAEPGSGKISLLKATHPDDIGQNLTLVQACPLFLSCTQDRGTTSYRFLFWFFRFVKALGSAAAFAPAVWLNKHTLSVIWRPLPSAPEIQGAMLDLSLLEPGLIRSAKKNDRVPDALSTVELLATSFLGEWVRHNAFAPKPCPRSMKDLVALFFSGATLACATPATQSLPRAIDSWLSVLALDFTTWRYRFTLRDATDEAESADVESPAFSLSMVVVIEPKPVALKDAVKKLGDHSVLRAPTALSNYLPEILELAKHPAIQLPENRLLNFLDHAAGLLSRLGIEVDLPKSLHRELKPRLVLHAEKSKNTSLVSYLDLNTVLDYHWSISIGDQTISLEEFEGLVRQKRALVKFRDSYLRIDPEEMVKLLAQARRPKKPEVFDLLKARFSGELSLSVDADELFAKMFAEEDLTVPQGLAAQLRPYQERGFAWVCSLLRFGFGCILADDMGLGKTIQAISVLLYFSDQKLLPGKTLVIAPAALLTNWEREVIRFAPSLSVARFHGSSRRLAVGEAMADVVLTTYQTAVRDHDKLVEAGFSFLIADEAHQLKNSQTRASQTVKSLGSAVAYRLALSGTPVENRLEDLRSLFDFVLPGYLGSADQFRKEFRIPIEVNRKPEPAERLRAITSPFVLRRLKIDKSIISDLPDKVITNHYAGLSPTQAALYESLVQNGLEASENATEGVHRSALILKMLTGLKQICDHPRVYDKESPADLILSGKAQVVVELLQEILRNDEKVLIFSQYVEALQTLSSIIRHELGQSPLLYHGGMSSEARDACVNNFQLDVNQRILLISLKAGGVGLNLTAASRVIHYDLWFNPAVESQATDRAFRIGQTKNVFVHRLICTGTFEEKIDAMLTSKAELAQMTLGSGESWLTRMSQEELRAVFSR